MKDGAVQTIAVDAMGGDHAPEPEVAGALAATREDTSCRVLLVGRKEVLSPMVGNAERIEIVHAEQAVTMEDHAAKVYREKEQSSLRVATELVKNGDADAVVSAGNSGAVLSHAVFGLGRLPGVERPAIVGTFPTKKGPLTVCDMGANVDVKASMLSQFAAMGASYHRKMYGNEMPKVGLLSNGTEAHKGTDLTRGAHENLGALARKGLPFTYAGYVEGSELFDGNIDVVATDGFTGNVVLKFGEGVSGLILSMIKQTLSSSVRGKIGGALVRPLLQGMRRKLDYAEKGGALLAGVNGVVIISHGKSDGTAIKNAILTAKKYVQKELVHAFMVDVKTLAGETA